MKRGYFNAENPENAEIFERIDRSRDELNEISGKIIELSIKVHSELHARGSISDLPDARTGSG